jgi:hypothetical protein
METSGFYKLDGADLLYGQNYIINAEYTLLREHKDEYSYPQDGWMWFDSEDQAREYFGIQEDQKESPDRQHHQRPPLVAAGL